MKEETITRCFNRGQLDTLEATFFAQNFSSLPSVFVLARYVVVVDVNVAPDAAAHLKTIRTYNAVTA